MKAILCLALVVTLTLGMAVKGFASTDSYYLEYHSGGTVITNGIYMGDAVRPGDSVSLEFPDALIKMIGGDNATYITKDDLKQQGVSVKYIASKGSGAVSGASISTRTIAAVTDPGGTVITPSYKQAYISAEVVSELVSTQPIDFAFTVYLSSSKTAVRLDKSNTRIEIEGTFENNITSVYNHEQYAYSGGKHVIKAEESIKGLEIGLENNLFATVNATRGQQYYGTCTSTPKDADSTVMSHPEFFGAYYLKQVGLERALFQFDLDKTYHVYNADGTYLGTTDDKIPYSAKYFLAFSQTGLGLGQEDSKEATAESSTQAVVEPKVEEAVIRQMNPNTGLAS